MKKFSILIVFFLLIGIALPFGNNVSANSANEQNKEFIEESSGVKVKILEDNASERVVQTTFNGETAISTYNKLNTELTIIENGVKVSNSNVASSISAPPFITFSVEYPTNPAIRKTVYSAADIAFGVSCKVIRVSYKDINIKPFRTWTIAKDSKHVTTKKETSKNLDSLQTFKNSVKELITTEGEFAAAGVSSYTAGIVTALTAPTGIGAVVAGLVAAGVIATAVGVGVKVYQAYKDVKLNYELAIE